MSTISIITCYIEWHTLVHLAARGGRVAVRWWGHQSPETLILIATRLYWWHQAMVTLPSRGQHMWPVPGVTGWQWDIGDPAQCLLSASGPLNSQIGAILEMRYWDISRVSVPQSPLKHSSVPARQFMLHSILKCIMNLYKRESLLSWYVFFYSSIYSPYK